MPITLETLLLGRNAVGVEGAQALAERLMQQPLHTLGLQFASLNEAGAAVIAPVLDRVKVLDVAGNHFGGHGAIALAEKLKGGSGLEALKLESNGVGDDGAKALGEAVATHKTLKKLE